MHERGVRKKFLIEGENFYITVGKTFAYATVPYENRPENLKLREIVNAFMDKVTETLEELYEEGGKCSTLQIPESQSLKN